ncbi:hypothetical protein CCMSSC00406_0004078 [Pleurotus cornucopiae]|uniref:Uncharacterized protein n=1 Tax=Pleurotus cornucopiae TaxID=5321 RepID=A0ACB7JD85_PLECO|nr:hypothetical protein CCMSSC00406_0004078 [Pleurotus cornucopiae]
MLMESLSAHYNHSDTPEPDRTHGWHHGGHHEGRSDFSQWGGEQQPRQDSVHTFTPPIVTPAFAAMHPLTDLPQGMSINPRAITPQEGTTTKTTISLAIAHTDPRTGLLPELNTTAPNLRTTITTEPSQISSTRSAMIGINYFGQDGQLSGCINDSKNVTRFLCSQFGYQENDIVVLTDEATNPRQLPTRENMIRAMEWLVRDAQPNDSLFFHYSGHGGQTKDLDGDEEDGFDEVVYPVDYVENGHITDSDMHDIMVKPLPAGCRLTAIYDSCHSGTALDLPYVYSTEGKIKEPNLAAEIGQGLLGAVTSYARGDMSGVLQSAMGIFKSATSSTKAEKIAKATRTSPADVISWSGCKDDQTSADTQEAGEATGAMSFAFVSSLRQNPQQSYQQLLNSVRDILRANYSQKPQVGLYPSLGMLPKFTSSTISAVLFSSHRHGFVVHMLR